jgi:ribokinase
MGRCTVVTPNQHEAAALGPSSVRELLAGRVEAVVVTRGAHLYRPGWPVLHRPPFAVRVRDTTGTGDRSSAALAWVLAGGQALEEAVRVAIAAGALSTRALGAARASPTGGPLSASSPEADPREPGR